MWPAIIILVIVVLLLLAAAFYFLLKELAGQRRQIADLVAKNSSLNAPPPRPAIRPDLEQTLTGPRIQSPNFGPISDLPPLPGFDEEPTITNPAALGKSRGTGGFGPGIGSGLPGASAKAATAETFHDLSAMQDAQSANAAQDLHEQLIDFARQNYDFGSDPDAASRGTSPAPFSVNLDELPEGSPLDDLLKEDLPASPRGSRGTPALELDAPSFFDDDSAPPAPAPRREGRAARPPSEEKSEPVPAAASAEDGEGDQPKSRTEGRSTVMMSHGGSSPAASRERGQHNYTPLLTTLFGHTRPARIVLEAEEIIIGRSADADFSLEDGAASRQHAKLVYTNFGRPEQRPRVSVVDLNSSNGVFVNGQKVAGSMPLPDNARISIGQTQMGFYVLSFPKRGLSEGAEVTSGGERPATPSQGVAASSSSGRDTSSSGRASTPAAPSPAASRVCIVDADFAFASDLRSMLEKTGRYSVVVYRSLEKALEGFKNPPNMLLLDVDLPGREMHEMCREIKSREDWAGVPIILLFGVLDHDRMRAARKAGAQSYLTKPISNIALLTNRIDIHMNINRMISTMGAPGGR
jgi:CheY-like chemotaxis protein